tara:strand:+ start:657 stop:932 length:276 start_codon:yes stop_codon:yes gene_type:complete
VLLANPCVVIPIESHIAASAAVPWEFGIAVANILGAAHLAFKKVWGVVELRRGCLLRQDILSPVYEVVCVVKVMLKPFCIEPVVVFAARDE